MFNFWLHFYTTFQFKTSSEKSTRHSELSRFLSHKKKRPIQHTLQEPCHCVDILGETQGVLWAQDLSEQEKILTHLQFQADLQVSEEQISRREVMSLGKAYETWTQAEEPISPLISPLQYFVESLERQNCGEQRIENWYKYVVLCQTSLCSFRFPLLKSNQWCSSKSIRSETADPEHWRKTPHLQRPKQPRQSWQNAARTHRRSVRSYSESSHKRTSNNGGISAICTNQYIFCDRSFNAGSISVLNTLTTNTSTRSLFKSIAESPFKTSANVTKALPASLTWFSNAQTKIDSPDAPDVYWSERLSPGTIRAVTNGLSVLVRDFHTAARLRQCPFGVNSITQAQRDPSRVNKFPISHRTLPFETLTGGNCVMNRTSAENNSDKEDDFHGGNKMPSVVALTNVPLRSSCACLCQNQAHVTIHFLALSKLGRLPWTFVHFFIEDNVNTCPRH